MTARAVIVGAAETTGHGRIPTLSALGLAADASLNALLDAGLTTRHIDGVATGYLSPTELAWYLGIKPAWFDSTSIGGSSWLSHVRHAAAAIEAGLCSTVLIAHGESGRSFQGMPNYNMGERQSLSQQFDAPYGWTGGAAIFGLPILRYMRDFGVTEEQLAMVAVVQREWAARNRRAIHKQPITVADVLSSPMIAYPLRRLMCCLVTDGGGALVLTRADRAGDLPQRPIYLLGSGEASESYLTGVAQVGDPLRPQFVRRSADLAFSSARIGRGEVNHLMIYDAFAHTPIFGLEGLGFVDYGEGAPFIAERHTAPGGALPMNTNGGGLNYAHSGSYGMFLMQESIRQLRGTADAQLPDVAISLCHAWGGYFSACATLILGNRLP
jgi:acetyl-CoA acetyltransferase